MTKLNWLGSEDVRYLTAADLSKAGVETTDSYAFTRFEPQEVPDDVALAVSDNPGLFGTFEFIPTSTPDVLVEVDEPAIEESPKPSKKRSADQ